jgi:hypothetical protein
VPAWGTKCSLQRILLCCIAWRFCYLPKESIHIVWKNSMLNVVFGLCSCHMAIAPASCHTLRDTQGVDVWMWIKFQRVLLATPLEFSLFHWYCPLFTWSSQVTSGLTTLIIFLLPIVILLQWQWSHSGRAKLFYRSLKSRTKQTGLINSFTWGVQNLPITTHLSRRRIHCGSLINNRIDLLPRKLHLFWHSTPTLNQRWKWRKF